MLRILILLACATLPAAAQLPTVFAVAGNGRQPRALQQEDVQATEFSLVNPRQVVIDAAGNIYINDVLSVNVIDNLNRIRYAAFPPEGGQISAIAVDGAGQLYMALQTSHCVLKRLVNGRVIPFAGVCGQLGDSGDGGPATEARLTPETIAADSVGNVYIWDPTASRIRRVSPEGVITTFHRARPFAIGLFNRTANLAVDPSGAVFFAQNSQPILRITSEGATEFVNIQSAPPMTFDAAGNFYYYSLPGEFRESLNPTLVRRNANGTSELAAGGGPDINEGSPSNAASLGNSEGLAFGADGSFYYPTGASRVQFTPPHPIFFRVRRINGIGAIGSRCIFTVPSRLTAPVTGATLSVTVSVNQPQCRWTAVADDSWAQLPANLGVRAGSGTFNLTIAPNGTARERRSRVTVFNQTIEIVQTGLTLSPPTISAVQSAASNLPGLASNLFISIYGTDFSSETLGWDGAITADGRLPLELGGARVRVAGRDCAIHYVSPTQINALIPPDLAGAGQVEVITGAGTARTPARETVAAIAPAFYTYSFEGVSYVAAVHTDGVLVAPEASGFGRPAKPGDIIQIFAAGLGLTSPRAPAGRLIPQPLALEAQARLDLSQRPVEVLYAGLVGPGLYQVNARIPEATPSGSQSLRLAVGLPETVAPLAQIAIQR
jgi:uncharacterized protein (TIGR03437 family)